MISLLNATKADNKYGGEPSFSQAYHLANLDDNLDRRWMDQSGTWVLDRKDSTCPGGCRMWYDDGDSLLTKYRCVLSVGRWLGRLFEMLGLG